MFAKYLSNLAGQEQAPEQNLIEESEMSLSLAFYGAIHEADDNNRENEYYINKHAA
jgi:hypothetical protein